MTTTDAAAPFNKPNADIILRSSDNVYFRLHRVILTESSPFFETMLTLPQSANVVRRDTDSQTPVINVPENARILDLLLRICYPVPDPTLDKLEDVSAVLAAAIKYDMEAANVLCRKALLDPEMLRKDPLGVYAVAINLKLEEETRTAARESLLYPYDPLGQPSQALTKITGMEHFFLVQYREQCRVAAVDIIDYHIRDGRTVDYDCDHCCQLEESDVDPTCRILAEQYRDYAAGIMARTPCGSALMNDAELRSNTFVVLDDDENVCDSCWRSIFDELEVLQSTIATAIDEAIDDIDIQLEF